MTISAQEKQRFLQQIQSCRYLLNIKLATNTTVKLIKFENHLALNELEICLNSDINLEEIHQNLIVLFNHRWERIRRDSFVSYTKNPSNLTNQLYLDLAHALSPLPANKKELDDLPPDTGPYFLLMPTLKAHQDIYEQNIHHWQLHEFILSDDDELFIPLDKCLQNALVSDTGEILHVVSKDNHYPALSAFEIERVSSHSVALKKYYNALMKFNTHRLVGNDFGAHLTRLNTALIAGGEKVSGEDFNAGAAANEGIFQFCEYWETLPPKQKLLLYRQFPTLEDSLGRLMRPDEENYRGAKFCVELIAKDLAPVITKYTSAQSIFPQLKLDVNRKRQAFLLAAKSSTPLMLNAGSVIPKIMAPIFSLGEAKRREIFNFEPEKNALLYFLEHYPSALPEFFHLLTDEEKKQAINAQFDPRGSSALIFAAWHGAEESVSLLLMAGAPVDAPNDKKTTPLQAASSKGYKTIVQTLLKYGAEIEATNDQGNTALHFAIRYGQKKIMKLLFRNGASIVRLNNRGNNALNLAINYHPELIAPILLKAITLNLQEQKELLHNVEDGIHQSILLFAAAQHPFLLNNLLNLLKEKRYALVCQETLDAQNHNGETALLLAAKAGNNNVITQLLEMGANIHAHTIHNTYAVHKAAQNGHLNTVKLLLASGLGIDTRGSGGNTILQYTVRHGQGRVMNYLLANGADIKCRTEKGNNALDQAIYYNPEFIKPLLLTALFTLSFDEQKEFLKNVEGGIYESILIYVAVEQPDFLPDVLNLLDIDEKDFVNANQEMQDFFNFDTHIKVFHDKAHELEKKAVNNASYNEAARTAKLLVKQLMVAKMNYIFSRANTIERNADFIRQCNEAIAIAKPFLEVSFLPRLSGFFSPKIRFTQFIADLESEIANLVENFRYAGVNN
ncbi:MAG: ankyrin repeat domain-containing protein [Legionella sp.]|nr:ankyrin repeat domain-containing protein [Legionella sp.]